MTLKTNLSKFAKTIEEVEYDAFERVISILYKDGKKVVYNNISKSVYEELTDSPSPDNWCLRNLNRYKPNIVREGCSNEYYENEYREEGDF